ncbi:MAG: aldo/keto reductase [Erysipelotrichaceae bacterium]|nr:aldo/keto reductase [Erysipelotrichaceae bacterium]
MKYITLAENIKETSVIGIGCMRIGSKEKKDVEEIIRTALDCGINFFDHADIYGRGKSEELFGEVLKDNPGLRDKMVIQSKCGINMGMYDFSKGHIINSVNGILERLNTDYIDSLLLHRPDVLMEPRQVKEAFCELYETGKVKSFGVSNMNRFQMELLQGALPYQLTANQLQLSLAHTPLIDEGINVNTAWDNGIVRASGTLEYLKLNNITLQTWSPLQYGMFQGIFIDNDNYKGLNERMQVLADEYGVAKDTIAYSWLLRLPQKVQVITGTTTPARIINAAKAADIELTARQWYDLYIAAGNRLP